MSTIPATYHSDFTACLARSDAAEAQRLIVIVKAAQASGNARGFEPDLKKLAAIIESQPQGLAKRFTPLSGPIDMPLPPPLAARVEVTLAKLALAETPREVEVAKAEGLQLKADIENHVMFRAATTPASAKSLFGGMTGR